MVDDSCRGAGKGILILQHDAGSKLAATIRYSQFARATGVSLAHLVEAK